MKNEMPAPVIAGSAVVVLLALIGLFYFLMRPETIPEGKIDTSLPPPQTKAGGSARFGPALDNTGQAPPVKGTVSPASGS